MRDRYNLNLLPGMSEDGMEYGELQEDKKQTSGFICSQLHCSCVFVSDDVDLNSVAAIPGMGIPEQLKAAMEQEQSSKSDPRTASRFPGFSTQIQTAEERRSNLRETLNTCSVSFIQTQINMSDRCTEFSDDLMSLSGSSGLLEYSDFLLLCFLLSV